MSTNTQCDLVSFHIPETFCVNLQDANSCDVAESVFLCLSQIVRFWRKQVHAMWLIHSFRARTKMIFVCSALWATPVKKMDRVIATVSFKTL